MGKIIDLVNQKFERLTVIKMSPNRKHKGKVLWYCECDCGNIIEVEGSSLKSGNTKSCGCYNREAAVKRLYKHGMASNSKSSSGYLHEYNTWILIKQRCYNVNSPDYCNYGARGINIFSEWVSDFQKFYDYLLTLSETREAFEIRTNEKATLDRIDVNGNYEPGNLRWASRLDQARNKTNNVVDEYTVEIIRNEYSSGEYSEQQLADKWNCHRSTISRIITNRNWY